MKPNFHAKVNGIFAFFSILFQNLCNERLRIVKKYIIFHHHHHISHTMNTNKYGSRHGQLADGNCKVSIVASEATIEVLKRAAERDRRSLSQFLSILAEREAAKLVEKDPGPILCPKGS